MVDKRKKLSIIVHSGTMDKLYPVLMLASTASAMDVETYLFFTFWGLNALKKEGFASAKLPGIMRIGTGMMKGRVKKAGVPTLDELFKMSVETGNVKIYACSTTMEMMNVKRDELISHIDGCVGASTFLGIAMESDIALFI